VGHVQISRAGIYDIIWMLLLQFSVPVLIAWATVFVYARRVANANPIHALRYE
jgi:ABC-type antimicrobial peptide transport system permease subunit